MSKSSSIPFVVLALIMGVAQAGAQRCEKLQDASPQQLNSYVENTPQDDSEAECLTFAIYKIGEAHYAPAIPAVVGLLAFRRPPDEHEKLGYRIRMRGFYPAIDALFELGHAADPAVLEAIKNDATSQVARQNALQVWMLLHRDEPVTGIKILRTNYDHSDEPTVRERLRWALSKAQEWCGAEQKEKCRLAAESPE